MALDAEFDRLIRESTPLIEGLGKIDTVEELRDRFDSMTPEEAEARRKAWKKWRAKSRALEREEKRLERKSPLR